MTFMMLRTIATPPLPVIAKFLAVSCGLLCEEVLWDFEHIRNRVAQKYCSGIWMGHNDPAVSPLVFVVKSCCSLNKSFLHSKLINSQQLGFEQGGGAVHLNEHFHPRFYMHMSAWNCGHKLWPLQRFMCLCTIIINAIMFLLMKCLCVLILLLFLVF